MTPNLRSSFCERMGLREGDRDVCLQAVRDLYPRYEVRELDQQGYCSITLFVILKEDTALPTGHNSLDIYDRQTSIFQIRPEQHALDEHIVAQARGRYGSLVPGIRRLDCNILPRFQTYEMEMLAGTPFSRYQPQTATLDDRTLNKQVRLIQSFASFVAKAWPSSPSSALISPHSTTSVAHCPGKVGSGILPRLAKLTQLLPDHSLHNKAAETLSRIQSLADYPIVINHGDLIPSNILVNPSTWELKGVVDWAEAEYLPFGTHLYGLEHLLGYLSTEDPGAPRFCYYRQSKELREVFWDTLCKEAKGVKDRLEDVCVARDMGVLLWYGFAWDEGKIDRVVNERDDKEEVECLRRFLDVKGFANCAVTEPP